MIKVVGLFELPDGVDVEEYWRDHTVGHAIEIAERAGHLVDGYIINRLRAPLAGEPRFWGMIELWFADAAARERFDALTDDLSIGTSDVHFEDWVVDFAAVEVEEHVVVAPAYAK